VNHVYRLVFNRALGIIQVVSELATSSPGGRSGPRSSLRPHRLSQACALLLATGLAAMAPMALAATAAAADRVPREACPAAAAVTAVAGAAIGVTPVTAGIAPAAAAATRPRCEP
jgi:hypothetical protein